MKKIVLIILVILSASCSSSKGPAVTVKERRNIQAYLSDRHAPSEVQIIRIDAPDSVFSPFNELISLKYRKARINRDAWEICKNAAFLADNRARRDSINRALDMLRVEFESKNYEQYKDAVEHPETTQENYPHYLNRLAYKAVFSHDGITDSTYLYKEVGSAEIGHDVMNLWDLLVEVVELDSDLIRSYSEIKTYR